MNQASNSPIIGVSQLTSYIKASLEEDPSLQNIEVQGEVANVTYHRSGHVYFTLKDAHAQISAVLFKMHALRSEKIETGESIIATGNISVYAPRGNYQLLVRKIRKRGTGDLFQQFIALRDRLKAEGLFDPSHKQPIPLFARRIGVITSPTGAAIRDIVQTLSRRYSTVEIKLFPAIVQGERGASSLVKAIGQAQDYPIDLIILGRGGGSIEDLWNFNEEQVARAIYRSSIPIITGIGHESDFTIADFVSDLRASTPTAAAEQAVPNLANLQEQLDVYESQLKRSLFHFIDVKRQILDDYLNRMVSVGRERMNLHRHQLELLQKELEGMSPSRILKQGFTLTLHKGQVIQNVSDIGPGDIIESIFEEGKVSSRVEDVQTSSSPKP